MVATYHIFVGWMLVQQCLLTRGHEIISLVHNLVLRASGDCYISNTPPLQDC